MLEQYKDILSIQQLQEVLGCGKDKAYELVHKKIIYSFPLGRKIKVPKYAVIEYISSFM